MRAVGGCWGIFRVRCVRAFEKDYIINFRSDAEKCFDASFVLLAREGGDEPC